MIVVSIRNCVTYEGCFCLSNIIRVLVVPTRRVCFGQKQFHAVISLYRQVSVSSDMFLFEQHCHLFIAICNLFCCYFCAVVVKCNITRSF